MKIVIVEDEYLIADMLTFMLKRNGYKNILHADSIEVATQFLDDEPDVFLLDIRIHDKNGIDFAKKLQVGEIPFVFITANNELDTIKQAALTYPQAYLTKPIHEKDLIAILEIIRAKLVSFLWVKTNMGKIKLNQNEILFIEADNVYSKIICESSVYLVRITLKELEDLLSPFFVKVHRSFIVNKNKINTYKCNELKVANFKIPVSKKYQKHVQYQ